MGHKRGEVLLVFALGATRGTCASHESRVHAELASSAVGVLAHRDEGFTASGSFHSGVTDVRSWCTVSSREHVMVRKGSSEWRPEGWVGFKSGRTTAGREVAKMSKGWWLEGAQREILRVSLENFKARSDDRGSAGVVGGCLGFFLVGRLGWR